MFIKTYGCQMNVYDSARMADASGAARLYCGAIRRSDADLVILNTCHIREKAAEKVYSELGTIRRLKAAKARRGGRMIVAVAGCVAQAEGAEIMRRAPCVDLVFGPQSYHRLPELGRSRAARRRHRGARHQLSRRTQIRLPAGGVGPARRDGFSDGAGRLRQVLQLLRRPLYARRGILASGAASARRGAPSSRAAARARSPSSGKTSMPITGRVPTAESGGWAS